MNHSNIKMGGLILLAILLCQPGTTWAKHRYSPPHEATNVSQLFDLPDANPVDGAVVLTRDFANKRIRADITASSLAMGEAYSIWWVVFNRPWHCAMPWQCASTDLGTAAVRASAFWAGGFIADSFGIASHTIAVGVGKTRREALVGEGIGLRNLRGAEVHVVLRSHGPAGVAGTVAAQIGTANEACVGGPPCPNKFFSLHRAR